MHNMGSGGEYPVLRLFKLSQSNEIVIIQLYGNPAENQMFSDGEKK